MYIGMFKLYMDRNIEGNPNRNTKNNHAATFRSVNRVIQLCSHWCLLFDIFVYAVVVVAVVVLVLVVVACVTHIRTHIQAGLTESLLTRSVSLFMSRYDKKK